MTKESIDSIRDDLARVDQRVRAALRERPFVAIGSAVAAGFLLGRALRGR